MNRCVLYIERKGVLMMKKPLGKKTVMNDGTMIAFATCSCDSSCKLLGCNTCSIDKAQNTVSLQNYSKLLSKAISGTWAM